jgi:ribosomal protein S18 acetylase RimI-like enzyme
VTTVVNEAPLRWAASRDGQAVGRLRAMIRPDGRCFLFFVDPTADAYGPLLGAARQVLRRDLYAEVDEDDAAEIGALTRLGFTVNRREHRYVLPTGVAGRLARRRLPAGFAAISAARADVDRLRELDDALRQDVPGSAGWRNDPTDFARQTFDTPEFDPATYLVAVEEASGGYVGLARVWANPRGPRLGLVGVLAPYRRRGLTLALLSMAFAVLAERGYHEVSCEVDERNTASNALMEGLGGRRAGGFVELRLPLPASRTW